MSKLVESLLDNAYQDFVLLRGNSEKGDVFSVPREVDFMFYAPDQALGELVASFINDNCYGDATYYKNGEQHCVKVVVFMPTEQHLINSVSGLMTCIAGIYGLTYDGWGCALQNHT